MKNEEEFINLSSDLVDIINYRVSKLNFNGAGEKSKFFLCLATIFCLRIVSTTAVNFYKEEIINGEKVPIFEEFLKSMEINFYSKNSMDQLKKHIEENKK